MKRSKPLSRSLLAYDRLRKVYDLVPVGIFICSAENLQILHVNEKAQKLVGYTKPALQSMTLANISAPAYRDKLSNALDELKSGSQRSATIMQHRMLPMNEAFNLFCRVSIHFMQDDPNEDDGLLTVTCEDITDTVQKQFRLTQKLQAIQNSCNTLKASRDTIQSVMEYLPEGMAILDVQGRITYINPHARKMLHGLVKPDLPPEEWSEHYGVYLDDQITVCPPDLNPVQRVLKGQIVEDAVFYMRNKANTSGIWTLTSGAPIYINGKFAGAVVIYRDITPIIEQKKALQRSNADLERFAAIAAHDLAEPPRQISAFIQRTLQKFGDEIPPKAAQYLQISLNSANRMQNLVSSLLSYSRVERKGGVFRLVDLNQVLFDVLEDFEHRILENNAKIHYEKLPCVEADVTQMQQLFANLLSNALKFRKKDIDPKVEIYTFLQNGFVVLEFKDNGIGFNPQYQDAVFEIFKRLVGKSEFPGTGIGLALCKRIVERHKGHIEVDSLENVGSCFRVRLPVHQE